MTMTMIKPHIELNKEQQDVADIEFGAYLVDAGAGSGKTTAVTELSINLVASGVDPDRILQVTFTVDAALEMSQRLFERTGRRLKWVTNFHRLCTRLMRLYPEIGLPEDFSIVAVPESKDIIKEILAEVAPNADAKIHTSQVFDQIARNRSISVFPDQEPLTFWAKRDAWIADAATEYDARLAREFKVDFDLMLYKVLLALREQPELCKKISALWDHVIVDEFQDTDPVQLEILKLIAPHGNVVGVGDMDQGIYRFRGAEPRNMNYFVDHFQAKVLPLQVNYRSRPEILDLANRVIANNLGRFPKTLIASKNPGGQVYLRQYGDSAAEAESVAREVKTLIRTGVRPEEIAVLYRVGSASRQVETAFMKNSVPSQVLGGMRFWDRREVQDVLAWAMAFAGRKDWKAWQRAAQNPKVDIGSAGWAKARKAGNPEDGLEAYCAGRAGKLLSAIRVARSKGKGADALQSLLETSGYMDALREECASNPEDLAQREGNVRETLSAIREFDSVNTFLDELALGCPERGTKEKRGVVLSTIHAAKGLEWDHVFIVALADEVLPHYLALKGTEDDLAEERRLLYVAITRARQGLHMSFATFLDQPGASAKTVVPSRFITEAGMGTKIRRCCA
jgi:DNA helicase-2/ATP-dependent DNA helicase PcrA